MYKLIYHNLAANLRFHPPAESNLLVLVLSTCSRKPPVTLNVYIAIATLAQLNDLAK